MTVVFSSSMSSLAESSTRDMKGNRKADALGTFGSLKYCFSLVTGGLVTSDNVTVSMFSDEASTIRFKLVARLRHALVALARRILMRSCHARIEREVT